MVFFLSHCYLTSGGLADYSVGQIIYVQNNTRTGYNDCRFENAVKDHPQMSSVKIIVNACRIKPVQTLCRLFFQLVQTSILFTNLLYVSSILKVLGVRSLANASRARQFNPLNPPGVGWVKLIIFLRWAYLSAHACQIWVRSVAKDF